MGKFRQSDERVGTGSSSSKVDRCLSRFRTREQMWAVIPVSNITNTESEN